MVETAGATLSRRATSTARTRSRRTASTIRTRSPGLQVADARLEKWRTMAYRRTAHALELYAKQAPQQTRFTLSSSLRRIHSECRQWRVYRFHPLLALPLNYDMSLDGVSRNRAFPFFHQAANVGHEAKWHEPCHAALVAIVHTRERGTNRRIDHQK